LTVLAAVLLAALAVVVIAGVRSRPTRPVHAGRAGGPGGGGNGSTMAGWPSARDTGAAPRLVTHSLPVSGGFYSSDATNVTIANTEIDGGIYWAGSGTLTLRNDILKPDWKQAWATVAAMGGGNVTIDHVTITGVNRGAPGQYTKGILMKSGGSLNVAYLNESGICQNNLGSGPTMIRDSYLHDIGSGDAATCHATGIEIEGPTRGPITITHNTIDEFPGRDFSPGSDGAIFAQPLYGPISGIVINDNFLHAAYSDVEVSPNGGYGITGLVVTGNCLAWPRAGEAVSDPRRAVTRWTGNTRCTLAGRSTGRRAPGP
jgi:hypothetical protein